MNNQFPDHNASGESGTWMWLTDIYMTEQGMVEGQHSTTWLREPLSATVYKEPSLAL